MREWQDEALVVGVRAYGESAAIARLLTREHGLYAGYVHQAQRSSRLRSILEPGNIVQAQWQSKSDEEALGFYQLELDQPIGPYVFESGDKLQSVQSLCQLADMALPERAAHEGLFESSKAYCTALNAEHWMAMYVVWEMTLLKTLGFALDLTRCAASGRTDNLIYISPKSGCAVCAEEGKSYKDKLFRIPDFLKGGGDDSLPEIAEGLKVTGHFLQRHVFDPVYKQLPEVRQRFYNKICERIG